VSSVDEEYVHAISTVVKSQTHFAYSTSRATWAARMM